MKTILTYTASHLPGYGARSGNGSKVFREIETEGSKYNYRHGNNFEGNPTCSSEAGCEEAAAATILHSLTSAIHCLLLAAAAV